MPGYEDAMFMQTEQMRFLRSAHGVRFMAAFDMSMREREYANDTYADLPADVSWTLATRMLEQADPVYVSPRVVEMIDYARGSFEPEVVLPTDLFTACGFAYMPRAVVIPDVRDEPINVRAVGWLPVRGQESDGMEVGGVWVMMWSHREDDIASGREGMTPEVAQLIRSLPHAELTLVHSFWLPYNDRAWENISDERFKDAAARQWGLAQVLWRLGSQVVRTAERAPRAARRDARRHGLDLEHVTVIKLRKTESMRLDPTPEEGEGDGDYYSVQFVVRGHWRNQWYPSKGEHRQVWISPYVKGPEDAPLQTSKRVFELVR